VKIHNPHLAQNPEVSAIESADDFEKQNCPMRAIRDLGGYSTVFLPGESPSFILKTSTSAPKMINLRGTGVRGMSSFHTAGCDRGFIYIDTNGIARVSQLPSDARFDLGLSTKKIPLGNDISGITYHHDTDCFVAGTSAMEPFELPKDDEQHREWQKEDTSFRPLVERGILKLISPSNWSVIDTVELDPYEVVMCIKTLELEISENSHERRQLITVGTAVTRGEDLPVKGCVYVYDIVTVVPEPDRPETNKKMKLIAQEESPWFERRWHVTSSCVHGHEYICYIGERTSWDWPLRLRRCN
jgi:cleavage and polyadenylation specificity factor subunit 1